MWAWRLSLHAAAGKNIASCRFQNSLISLLNQMKENKLFFLFDF